MQNTSLMSLLFSYTGRINRAKFWLAALIYFAIMIVLIAIAFVFAGNSLIALSADEAEDVVAGIVSKSIGLVLLALVVYIPMVISGVMVGIKRLHDRDKSGWWLIVFYLLPSVFHWMAGITFIFSLVAFALSIWGLVELGILRGTAGPNKYGPDPLPSASPVTA